MRGKSVAALLLLTIGLALLAPNLSVNAGTNDGYDYLISDRMTFGSAGKSKIELYYVMWPSEERHQTVHFTGSPWSC